MSSKQGYWANFSTIGIGIMQQVLGYAQGSARPGFRDGRLRDECADNKHHQDYRGELLPMARMVREDQ
jgi:hypothetical protein